MLVCLRSFLGMLSVGGRVLPVVTAVLGVVGEVVQVVATAGVAWPYPEGRADAENLQKKNCR